MALIGFKDKTVIVLQAIGAQHVGQQQWNQIPQPANGYANGQAHFQVHVTPLSHSDPPSKCIIVRRFLSPITRPTFAGNICHFSVAVDSPMKAAEADGAYSLSR